MVITINVNVTGLDNFAAVFAKLTAPAQEMKVQVLPTAPTQSLTAPVPVPVVPNPVPVPVPVEQPLVVQQPAPVQQQSAVPTATQSYTVEQLGVAATQLMDAGRKNELVQLLASFGVQALTQLPKEMYGNFALQLRQLGARI